MTVGVVSVTTNEFVCRWAAKLEVHTVRQRPSNWIFVRIDQTSFGRSACLGPMSLPLFQGSCLGTMEAEVSSCMVILLNYRG